MPAPIGITCDLCGQKFFQRSLPIHRKQCEKKFAACYSECSKCLRKVSNDEIGKHEAECKVVRKKAVPRPKVVKDRPIKPPREAGGEEESSSEESSDEEDCREQCGFCQRKFNADRIAKHESICATNAQRKKRKKYKTSSEQRLEGTDFEAYMDPSTRRTVRTPPTKWRQDHERLQGIVEQGRLVKVFKEAGVPLTELPRSGADLNSLVADDAPAPESTKPEDMPVQEGMKRCPHCARTFASVTAERHIPKCKNTVNKPKKLVRKSKPVLDRPKQDNSGLIKSLIKKVLLMRTKKNDFFETKEASMFREGEAIQTHDGRTGTVRFIGRVAELFPGYWVGVELDAPEGKNDGSVQGTHYFSCEAGRGTFLRPSKLRKRIVLEAPPPSKAEGAAGKQRSETPSSKPKAQKEETSGKKAPEPKKSKAAADASASKLPKKGDAAQESKDKKTSGKKGGMVEKLRNEVRLNSPRSVSTKPRKEKHKQTQRPEVDSPPEQRKPAAKPKPKPKKNMAEEARRKRIEKDAKMLEALTGNAPPPGLQAGGSREEIGHSAGPKASSLDGATGGKVLGKPSNASGAGASAGRPDRAARAAYFEKMFAQKQQEAAQ